MSFAQGDDWKSEVLDALKRGETITFGCNGRNTEVMEFMSELESDGLIETEDLGLSQETRREARWVSEKEAE